MNDTEEDKRRIKILSRAPRINHNHKPGQNHGKIILKAFLYKDL